MFCSKCGTAVSNDSVFCQHCGQKQSPSASKPDAYEFVPSAPAVEQPKGNTFWKSWSQSRKSWFIVVMIFTVLAALNGQNLFSYVMGMATGEVQLDSGRIESVIEAGVLEQVGEATTATCPRPLSAKVGDTRQCTVVDSIGGTYFVDITVQNSNGDITWKVQN